MIEYAKGFAKEEMMAVMVCEKFGWTYEEFLDQPDFFINLIIEKIKVDDQRENNAKKSK